MKTKETLAKEYASKYDSNTCYPSTVEEAFLAGFEEAMKPIEYEDRIITPIMKPMLCWDDDESNAKKCFVYAKEDGKFTKYPWVSGPRGWLWVWKHVKPIPEEKPIELTLKEISEKTGIPEHLIRIKK